MILQTQVPLKPFKNNNIDYNSNLVLFGSCFSEHIGQKLKYHKLQTTSNPFGILFHPKAIEILIEKSVLGFEYDTAAVFELNEQFQCFDAHSKLNTLNELDLVNNLNSTLKNTFQYLKKASHVIITLGTAWAYRNIETDVFVANCHKVPQKNFKKELLSIEEINESLQRGIDLITGINPEVQFVFTVSPVRHLKDGFTENTLSKAHLITAVNTIVKAHKNTHYFPSYEIMMDELRDYRFYNEDLIHPNTTAINYIWDCFNNVWFSDDTRKIIQEISTIQKGLNHKPFNPKSKAHEAFLLQLNKKKANLTNKLPHISF